MKTKLKTYDDKFNTAFLYNEIPKKKQQQPKNSLLLHCNNLYKIVENYPQVYLEQCKYRQKKKRLVGFIDIE